MDNLPVEVLENIFKFLPLGDRKNVRLTSHIWNDACNCPSIVKREKFVFRFSSNNKMDMVTYILNCSNLRSTFEFQLLKLSKHFLNVLEQCGRQLERLHIIDCELCEKTLYAIFVNCPNLKVFLLHLFGNDHVNQEKVKIWMENTLDDMIRRNVERRNLISFEFCLKNQQHMGEWFRKLFSVYPNINTLGVTFESTKLPLNLQSKLKRFLVSLNFPKNTADGIDDLRNFLASQNELKELSLGVRFYGLERDSNLRFVSLERDSNLKSLLFTIIRSLPKLKKLVFLFLSKEGVITFADSTEFNEFLNGISHMKTVKFMNVGLLSISGNQRGKNDWKVPMIDSSTTTLKELQIDICDEKICLAILNRCHSLKYLHLKNITMKIWQNILTRHTELRTLQFDLTSEYPSSPDFLGNLFDKMHQSVHKFLRNEIFLFQDLEEIKLSVKNLDQVSTYLSAFNFPNLRRFSLRWSHQYVKAKLLRNLLPILDSLSTKAPHLKYLKLSSISIVMVQIDEIASFVNKWKTLRTIGFMGTTESEGKSTIQYVQKLFIRCPSLNCVILGFSCAYCYDHYWKKLTIYPLTRI